MGQAAQNVIVPPIPKFKLFSNVLSNDVVIILFNFMFVICFSMSCPEPWIGCVQIQVVFA